MPRNDTSCRSKPSEPSLFYQAKTTGNMWDTWLYWHDGLHYLFHLAGPGGQWHGIAMATSRDGVHWHEHGLVLEKAEGVIWLGTGTVWNVSDKHSRPHFIMNFSEWKGSEQTIFFAESSDLLHWKRLPSDCEFRPDGRWYKTLGGNDARWDCIFTIPRKNGGWYGYWTANPRDFVGFGFGESIDGVTWKALPPPRIDWGQVQPMASMESGAVAEINGRYYTMVGAAHGYYDHRGGMFTCVADAPEGPFRPASVNFAILTSPPGRCHTYFARFYPFHSQLLVNHHAVAYNGDVFFAPLKIADLDAEGVLRLKWWPGNDAGFALWQTLPVAIKDGSCEIRHHPARGIALEAVCEDVDASTELPTVTAECDDGSALLMSFNHDGSVEFVLRAPDGLTQTVERIDRCITLPPAVKIRLLLMRSFIELYLEDHLIQVYSLHAQSSGMLRLRRFVISRCVEEY